MKSLHVVPFPFDESELVAWMNGEYTLLEQSRAAPFIKDILVAKARKRPGRRFLLPLGSVTVSKTSPKPRSIPDD